MYYLLVISSVWVLLDKPLKVLYRFLIDVYAIANAHVALLASHQIFLPDKMDSPRTHIGSIYLRGIYGMSLDVLFSVFWRLMLDALMPIIDEGGSMQSEARDGILADYVFPKRFGSLSFLLFWCTCLRFAGWKLSDLLEELVEFFIQDVYSFR